MLEKQLQRCIDELKQDVLEVLTRHINEAFAHVLRSLGSTETATTATPQSRPVRARRKGTRPRPPHAREVLEATPEAAKPNAADASQAPAEPTATRPRRGSKGPSREEIARLVEAGLAARLASEATATAHSNSDA
jgi:hypothetical protein